MASIPPSLTSPSGRGANFRDGVLPAGAGIALVAALAWAYVVYMVWGMEHMDLSADWVLMPRMTGWNGADLVLVFAMWSIMMAAMMLPAAAPLLLLLARIHHARHSRFRAAFATGVAGLGYLAAWTGFSLLATLAQWGLLEARLVSPMMDSTSSLLSGALLTAAGAYQFTPLKHACLGRCRSPLSVLLNEWREGYLGAFRMGLSQGAYCTGCCWLLMTLLFAFGVMNLIWIAALSLLVLLEKIVPQPRLFAHATGAILLVWGVLLGSRPMFLPN
jgi:predicted metal-binding membrane protein